jgi:colanic acid/amylovoran biosynthesis glycosyltransferase
MKKEYISILLFFFLLFLESFSDSLNVLFCVRRFPTNTAWFIVNQMIAFIKEGHNITIYTEHFDQDSINMNHPDIVEYNLVNKTHTLLNMQKEFDIILCQSAFLAPKIIALRDQGKLSGKLIIFVREAFKEPLLAQKQKIFSRVDLIMPVCEYFKNRLVDLGCNPDKIVVLHSAIDTKKFSFKKRTKEKNNPIIKLVTVSRLNEKKGIHFVLYAIKSILKKHPNIQYTVLGDGNYKAKLEQLIKKLNLNKVVCLLGWKCPEEVKKNLDDAHIFVLASATSSKGHEEGIPNALMEACACGLPVISTKHAGIPELVLNGKSGFLVPEHNIEILAKKLDYLMRHSKLWPKMGIAGRKMVEQYFDRTIENKKLIDICCKLAKKDAEV